MKKKIQSCKCGSIDFISKPNRYDVYQIIGGSLQLIQSPFTEDEIKLYCCECGEELIGADELVPA
ncbi:MAG: hypothetical protein AAB255_04670 [Bacteroidota bacterium]